MDWQSVIDEMRNRAERLRGHTLRGDGEARTVAATTICVLEALANALQLGLVTAQKKAPPEGR